MERRSPNTAHLLRERLELIHRWYQGMTNPTTGMLEYFYIPETDRFLREHSPIRDIASIWDVELLEDVLGRSELRAVVETSLRHYRPYILQRGDYAIVDPVRLEEPSSIAHSAFMMLALLHAPGDRATQEIVLLRDGVTRCGSLRRGVEAGGRLPHGLQKLVAVEYIVINVGQPRPTFNGHPFDIGGTPVPVPHWSLHVWLYANNPDGQLTAFNPSMACHQH